MRRFAAFATLLCASSLAPLAARSQSHDSASPTAKPPVGISQQLPAAGGYDPLGAGPHILSPITQPTLSPEVIHLLELEGKFADSVAAGGGKAFASWFADDAVTLGNGKPPVIGKQAIAATAQWDPKDYQLTWVAEGARMGPSKDMGFTWGHYTGTAKDVHGGTVSTTGRYMTVWKKAADGSWKVVLDASADDTPEAGSCCTLPKP